LLDCKSLNKQVIKVKKSRNESVFEETKEAPAEEEKNEVAANDSLNIKRPATEDLESLFIEEGSYYYCLGLDLYLVMEPCVMCAMALGKRYLDNIIKYFVVHSRINRVFYSIPYQGMGEGGLNEKIQLNNLHGLNHRYKVFYNILSKETSSILTDLSKVQDHV